jgi:hypothetical protein
MWTAEVHSGQLLINALTVQVQFSGENSTGYPTNQELAQNLRGKVDERMASWHIVTLFWPFEQTKYKACQFQ